MIETLVDRVWSSAAFQADLLCLSKHWLQSELHLAIPEPLTEKGLVRLVRAAAILACSPEPRHTEAAYRIATSAFELRHQNYPGVRAAAEVVLARMGNFPGLQYLEGEGPAVAMPIALALEQQARRQGNEVVIAGETVALTDFQVGLWADLFAGNSIGVSAPTSAGKSFVVQAFLRHAAEAGGLSRIVYIVPSRALISQVAEDIAGWAGTASDHAVTTFTVPLGPRDRLPDRGVFVFTQERLHLSQLNHPALTFQLIIVDEAHVIADRSRGVLLASTLDEALRRNPVAQVLFASPNIENPEIFGKAFGLKRFTTRRSNTISVAQNLILVDTPAPYKRDMVIRGRLPDGDLQIGVVPDVKRTPSTIQKLIQTAHRLGTDAPSLVYANGPDIAEKVALGLAALRPVVPASPKLREFADFIREAVHPAYELANTVLHRVGFHYGRIPAPVRKAVEVAFSEGDIDFLVTTSTLLHGVNFPARNLFVCDPREGLTDPMAPVDFWNLAGRAGRLGREFQGNVFLIDYGSWDSRPLTGTRSTTVQPALSHQIVAGREVLLDCIRTTAPAPENKDRLTAESTFTRLYVDLKSGRLASTLARIVPADASAVIEAELRKAEALVSLPLVVIEQSPTISVHRQERLYLKLKELLAAADGNSIRPYIPEHPQSPKAYASYSAIFKLCHTEILGYPVHDQRNTRFAAIALRWMRGDTLPQIIDAGRKYAPKKKIGSLIRDTLTDIEQHIRFTYVRLTTCYMAVLGQILRERGRLDLAEAFPPLPLYLELGACQPGVIALISLGLSRITAAKLSIQMQSTIETQEEARAWLLRQDLDAFGLAPILIAEIRRALGIKKPLIQ